MNDSRKLFTKAITTSAAAYTAGDQVGTLQTLTGASDRKGQALAIESIQVVDTAQQKSELLLLFFGKAPTITSVDNGALNITDAQLQECLLGVVKVFAAEYYDVAGVSIANVQYPSLQLESRDEKSGTRLGQEIYMLVVTNGTPTYGLSSTALTVHVGVVK